MKEGERTENDLEKLHEAGGVDWGLKKSVGS